MSNYQAIIAKIDRVVEIPKADNIQIAFVLGEQCIVNKSSQVGDTGILFVAGTQLSEEYCKYNNLFRNAELNDDKTKTGFFEESRRVRAQPFLKVRSEGLFMPPESLAWTGAEVESLKVGDTFEDLAGKNVCKKYINPNAKSTKVSGNKNTKKIKKVTAPYFAEHVNTSPFKQNLHRIQRGDLISIHAKVHGTSHRSAYTKLKMPLPKWKRVINSILPIFPTERWEVVTGSRRTILTNTSKEGFHGSNGFRFQVTEALKPYLTKGMTIYGEIAGYANGKPIMTVQDTKGLKDKKITKKYGDQMVYKYGCVEGTHRFHVYRITMTTEDGNTIDFTQPQIKEWCEDRNILYAYDVVEPFLFDGDYDKLLAMVDNLTERQEVLGEDYIDSSHLSEGVVVRVDNGDTTPIFLKNKNFYFKVLEGIASEQTADMEDLA